MERADSKARSNRLAITDDKSPSNSQLNFADAMLHGCN
jgi:hypothetical protein